MFSIFFNLSNYIFQVELLNGVKRIQPDVLILFGPFMDKKNTVIQEGIIEVKEDYFSYESFLEHLFFSISTELSVKIYFLSLSQNKLKKKIKNRISQLVST